MFALIQSSSPEQAQWALVHFYEAVPAVNQWGSKPSLAALINWLDEAQDSLPAETLTVIDALLTDGSEVFKGEAAKGLLHRLAEQELLRPYLQSALVRSRDPAPAASATAIAALIVALTVPPRAELDSRNGSPHLRIEWNPTSSDFNLAARVAGLARLVSPRVLERAIHPPTRLPTTPTWAPGPGEVSTAAPPAA